MKKELTYEQKRILLANWSTDGHNSSLYPLERHRKINMWSNITTPPPENEVVLFCYRYKDSSWEVASGYYYIFDNKKAVRIMIINYILSEENFQYFNIFWQRLPEMPF